MFVCWVREPGDIITEPIYFALPCRLFFLPYAADSPVMDETVTTTPEDIVRVARMVIKHPHVSGLYPRSG